ncbi:CorA family divalent cation transporter [Luteibacter sp. PPL201]|uniref:CorA family divalent cation transporter n=1 Tax=Luteibacter sahnii TaxID=3021977 RepID=A0ABT6BCD0_9GAMM|nr:CorA family divalent cation transporter [Luteibacter sp. PPL193]MDY1549217.1 CorA family divalent cation transporter [Luteibacter sp. PPL193]
MLTLHAQGRKAVVWTAGMDLPSLPVWIDLYDPTDDERRWATEATGLRVPERSDVTSLALSSRIRTDDDDTMYLSIPYFADTNNGHRPGPIGLVVTGRVLLTLRFADSRAFELAANSCHEHHWETSADVFATLVEAIVNLAAQRMEDVSTELKQLSDHVFSPSRLGTPELRTCMLEVGRLEGMQARNRSSMLGVQRVVSFTRARKPAWMSDQVEVRLRVVDHDLRTLDEFDDQLTNKLQFVLDATLGFISTDQNHVMKVLTVTSVATIPPMILVGIWGMNFKDMPELNWPMGYPMALAAIVVSMVIPVLFFKWRGWWSGD